MTRINLVKYGFVRDAAEDFSDDGNRFQCYRVGRVLVTKLVSDGDAYIDGDINDGTLPYEVYSKLPHYPAVHKLNGVTIATLTEDDIQELYEACQAYEVEYTNAENSIKYPTLEEIQEKAVKLTAKSLLELSKIESLMSKYALEAATKFSPYEWKTLQEYTKNLMADVKRHDPEAYPQTILGQQFSFTFVKPDYDMKESYWFTSLRDLFAKYCMN